MFNTRPCFHVNISFIYLPSKQLSIIRWRRVCTVMLSDLIDWVNAHQWEGGIEEQRLDTLLVLGSERCFASGLSLCNRRQTQQSFKTPRSGRVLSSASAWVMINSSLTLHLHPYKFSGGCFGSLFNASHFCSWRPRFYTTLLIAISLGKVIFLLAFFFFLSILSNVFGPHGMRDHHCYDTLGCGCFDSPPPSLSPSLKVGDK